MLDFLQPFIAKTRSDGDRNADSGIDVDVPKMWTRDIGADASRLVPILP